MKSHDIYGLYQVYAGGRFGTKVEVVGKLEGRFTHKLQTAYPTDIVVKANPHPFYWWQARELRKLTNSGSLVRIRGNVALDNKKKIFLIETDEWDVLLGPHRNKRTGLEGLV